MLTQESIYALEKYHGLKSRHMCPACGYKHEFARYVDSEGNYLADHVGRCNRESKCGHHFKPKDYFLENPTAANPHQKAKPIIKVTPPTVYVDHTILRSTLKGYESNTFANYLRTIFDLRIAQTLIDQFGLGTTRDGSCIFWQVDEIGRVRTGKVIKYGADGHRLKDQKPYFIHTKLGLENIQQCLFGLHQLSVSSGPFGIVESEKTAVLMAGKLPQYTWMATGGKSASIISKLMTLKGKRVVCFPDTDAFTEWSDKIAPLGFRISDALQKYLTPDEQDKGLDIGDFIQPAKNEYDLEGNLIDPQLGYPVTWR